MIEGYINTYTATGLVTGMYYGFAVKAITAIATSELSIQETLMSAMVPDQPTSLQVTSQDET